MYAEDNPIFNDPHERQHFYQHITAMINYSSDNRYFAREYTLQNVMGDPFYVELLNKKSKQIGSLIDINQQMLEQIIPFKPQGAINKPTTQLSRTKLMSTFNQFYRQWSEESTEKHLYIRLVDRLKEFMNTGRVLIPGCGLARIVLEFVKRGFAAQGNEVSYFMLLGSDFILNQVSEKKSIEIAPFVHCTNNNLNDKMRLKTVMIPDSLACEEISPDSDFSMTSGDFLEVYGNQNAVWDSVVTCFFIDTANNVLNYIDLIHKLLRVGGVWLNYGPLLYHYHDQPAQVSIELSWQALRKYIAVKFEIVSETIEEATYCHMPDSMSISKYQCVYFTAKKR